MKRYQAVETFLKPLEALINDPLVSEVMVNAGPRVFVERSGELEEVHGVEMTEQQIEVAIRVIARSVGQEVNEEQPILEGRLPDGSRATGLLSPPAVDGPALTIRKFNRRLFGVDELIASGSLSREAFAELERAITRRENVLVSGATTAGKTTLLNALATLIGDDQRIVIVEDTPEIQLDKPNVVRLESRVAQEELPEISIRSLVRTTLRLRPDRIIVGEVRGAEAFDLMQALNTGHAGTFSTIHANSAAQALSRLETCVLEAKQGLPVDAIRSRVADCIDVVVQVQRVKGRRFVSEVVRVGRYQHETASYELTPCFTATETGAA